MTLKSRPHEVLQHLHNLLFSSLRWNEMRILKCHINLEFRKLSKSFNSIVGKFQMIILRNVINNKMFGYTSHDTNVRISFAFEENRNIFQKCWILVNLVSKKIAQSDSLHIFRAFTLLLSILPCQELDIYQAISR